MDISALTRRRALLSTGSAACMQVAGPARAVTLRLAQYDLGAV